MAHNWTLCKQMIEPIKEKQNDLQTDAALTHFFRGHCLFEIRQAFQLALHHVQVLLAQRIVENCAKTQRRLENKNLRNAGRPH